MNWLDLSIILIILAFVAVGWRRGLIMSVFSLVSFALSMLAAYKLAPILAKWMRESGVIYDSVRAWARDSLGLDAALESVQKSIQTEFINSLGFPEFVKKSLIENNNSEVYNIFGVDNFADYIAGTIANLIVSAVAFAVIFVLAGILLRVVANAMNLLARLPVLRFANKLGGAVLGAAGGLVVVFIFSALLSAFAVNPNGGELSDAVSSSLIMRGISEGDALKGVLIRLQ